MPRVNGVYELPPGSYGVPDTTIQSNKYNTVLADLAADANSPRPIGAGGTGATNASGARAALGLANAALTNVTQQWSAIQEFNNYTDVILRGGSGRSWARTTGILSIIESNSHAILALVAGTGQSSVFFGDAEAAGTGQLTYDHALDRFIFVAGGNNNRAVINSDGSATFAGSVHSAGFPLASVYTGGLAGETNFPIGHTVIADNLGGSNATLNTSYAVRAVGTASYEINGGSGTVLTGTWRCRGTGGPRNNSPYNTVMMQRVL